MKLSNLNDKQLYICLIIIPVPFLGANTVIIYLEYKDFGNESHRCFLKYSETIIFCLLSYYSIFLYNAEPKFEQGKVNMSQYTKNSNHPNQYCQRNNSTKYTLLLCCKSILSLNGVPNHMQHSHSSPLWEKIISLFLAPLGCKYGPIKSHRYPSYPHLLRFFKKFFWLFTVYLSIRQMVWQKENKTCFLSIRYRTGNKCSAVNKECKTSGHGEQ